MVRLISDFVVDTFVRFYNCLHGIDTSKYEWKYLHIASINRMYSQGRFYSNVFSGYSCIQSKLIVE